MMVAQGTYRERRFGSARSGQVGLREFDEGVVLTLGATLHDLPDEPGQGYFLSGVPGVCPPPGTPGLPVIVASPDDAFTDYRVPSIIVRPMAPTHAPQRWMPGTLQYRTAAPGALPVVVHTSDGEKKGFSAYESMVQAKPMDFEYEIVALGRTRGGPFERLPRDQVGSLHRYLLQRFSHHNHASVFVRDTAGDLRSYPCFVDSLTVDVEAQLADRTVQCGISLRVEGEIDISLPYVEKSVLSFAR